MAVFEYRARTSEGEAIRGELTAVDRAAALAALHEQGLYPSTLTPRLAASPSPRAVRRPPARVPLPHRAQFWRAGAQALRAGMSVARTMALLAETSHGPLRRFSRISQSATAAGEPLSDLMAERTDLFGAVELGLVRAGEASGRLDAQMDRLADYFDGQIRLLQRLRAPLAYLGCVGAVFLGALLVVGVIAPALSATVQGQDAGLAGRLWLFIRPGLLLLGGLFGLRWLWRAAPAVRRVADGLKWLAPGLAGPVRKLVIARFCQALAQLLGAGLPAGEAAELAVGAAGNDYLRRRLSRLPEQFRAGLPLSHCLAEPGLFPPQVIQMVLTGEEAGATDDLLARLSTYYESEAAAALQQLTVVATTGAFLLLALAVGIFAVRFFAGLYGPLLSLTE